MQNGGQTCISVERVYVEEPIYDEFVDRLAARVRELRQGVDGRDFKQDLGAMTFPAQPSRKTVNGDPWARSDRKLPNAITASDGNGGKKFSNAESPRIAI